MQADRDRGMSVCVCQCFVFAERYEEDIETWYYQLQDHEDLMNYLCADRYLKNKDQSMSCCHLSVTLYSVMLC